MKLVSGKSMSMVTQCVIIKVISIVVGFASVSDCPDAETPTFYQRFIVVMPPHRNKPEFLLMWPWGPVRVLHYNGIRLG